MTSSPNIPRALYRLQFHRGFTLQQALEWLPYLEALGISHLYASPLLQARPGSPHGYDVCDPNRLSGDLGTESDLTALVAALRTRGMGLILDIVPNHMGVGGPANRWWWHVLRHGRASPFADHFDIDWDPSEPSLRGKVLVPVLADDLERVLARAELTLGMTGDEVSVQYGDRAFPLDPVSLGGFALEPERAVAHFNADREALAALLEQQHYRLAHWRLANTQLNYRRFFAVSELAGVRVEIPWVFADSHNRLLDWHQRGLLDGFRVDHPDGLYAPQAYLDRLGAAAPGAWIVVEKILAADEELPSDWPVAGTTGYDFLNRVLGVFVDASGEARLTDFYAEFTGESVDFRALVREKKRAVLADLFVTEVNRLTRLLAEVATAEGTQGVLSPDELRSALIEVLACFPVYRTYTAPDARAVSPADEPSIAAALARAAEVQPPPSSAALALLSDLLRLDRRGELEQEFVQRFQQLSGPVMAKGLEDTAFYCYNRFVALNEVGGNPGRFGCQIADFHRACQHTLDRWPHTLLATSTHDTKRSEDVRARLAVLSEIPEQWTAAVRRWSALNAGRRQNGWPDRNAEYLFYQTVVGAWPLPLDRALAYIEKAVREAKQHTDWAAPHRAYEAALQAFVTGALNDPAFVEDLDHFVARLTRAGSTNALAQTVIKLTAPGVPDVYQGTELWDFSLVDPDNRRPVDFGRRQSLLAGLEARLAAGHRQELVRELAGDPGDERNKLFVLHQTLQHRRRCPELYRQGRYLPLFVAGRHADHVLGFARALGGATTITVVPRLVLRLAAQGGTDPDGEPVWEGTRLRLPAARAGHVFVNVFTGETHRARPDGDEAGLDLADLFGVLPVALLEAVPGAGDPGSRGGLRP